MMRPLMRGFARLMLSLLTRTTITGRENIPASGPLLILGNHRSTIDPMLLLAFLPASTEFVGPGDFKLLFPGDLIIRWYGLVQVKRSTQLERSSLKLMTDILNSGKMLGLFPDGGTWEKPITEAKPGAAYLSMLTGAPILPVGIGGAYRAWDKVARLQRPRLTVNIGKVMPPVQTPAERSKRSAVLEVATQTITQRIYDLLPTEDQAWYDDMARRRYDLKVEVWRSGWGSAALETIHLPGAAVLGEIMVKPNLISPLVNNAGLPLDPLRYAGMRFAPASVRLAAVSLNSALHGPFADYMEYRLGDAKARQLYTALDALAALTAKPDVTHIALTPISSIE
ncbi:MAG: 1-acyl-sn-glycerol-3-phosphate acyltransferase [Anaerolineae bacterium]|nr:1-acyl-sn-glycerol-3-phosphate acyltransferase [Anaerolineae bacterium]